MIYKNLYPDDLFSLQILETKAYSDHIFLKEDYLFKQESKKMNENIKEKYFDDLIDTMGNRRIQTARVTSSIGKRDMQHAKTKEYIQNIIKDAIQIPETNLNVQICNNEINGPLKWVIIILGPKHKTFSLKEHDFGDLKRINLIIVDVTKKVPVLSKKATNDLKLAAS
jgi:hypothetical protein